jgi:hypothetical protein
MAGDVYFRVGDFDAAAALVEAHHYSHRMASNVQLVGTWHEGGGLFGDYGPAVAAVVFSIPPTRWSEPVWELSRLVRKDEAKVTLSGLISQAISFMRRSRPCDLVVSFADFTQGHHGGIYQACSWNFHGKRDRSNDGCVINGTFVPGRSLNSQYGTRSADKLRGIVGGDVEPHYDEGKFLYWRSLSREGDKQAERLGLQKLPYPKPSAAEAA